MKSLQYIEQIKNDHMLSNDDLIDILEKLSYITRDNGEDDTILCDLMEMLTE